VSLCLFFLGCSNIPAYVEPTGEGLSSIGLFVQSDDFGGFSMELFEESNCTSPKLIADDVYVESGSGLVFENINVNSGELTSFLVAQIGHYGYCAVTFEFIPELNTKYVIFYLREENRCSVTAQTRSGDDFQLVSSFRNLEYNQPFSTNGPYCKK
jgi:hypothetical protein